MASLLPNPVRWKVSTTGRLLVFSVLIGVVGMQLAVEPDNAVAKVLPFYGPQQLIESSLSPAGGPILWPLVLTAAYGVVLMVVARAFLGHRLEVVRQ